uniref:hypothetical protein n=1 Tax=Cupriavidus taiwanensis TaxID=164546 RepID=UPI000E2E7E32|nr:hypothetical protein [Cupriavidus taiwanensis]
MSAEDSFRKAFERLKHGESLHLPVGSSVSQNNVAKEAGRDPSALRKSRYPKLIADIQIWNENHSTEKSSHRSPANVRRNRSLKEKIAELVNQRDKMASLLVEADAKILELTEENRRLQARLPTAKIASFSGPSPLKRS